MNTCAPFGSSGPAGIADALQKVDCLAIEATNISFGRLFGENGSLGTALTILLTLYVAFLALNLMTGRSPLRVSVLTPRMMTMGLVLTFVTSWVAYQSVVWNLAVGAPDEIAAVLIGTKDSATSIFAQRLDMIFEAITGAASSLTPEKAASATFASPANILSIAALILLLGTVGVLVVCRLALAALLILGPIFIVLALFENTRGLFEGWLKSVAMFALVPLLTVVIGSGAITAIAPMVSGLGAGGGDIPLRAAVSILVASIVYVALMLTVMKVAGTLTRGWRLSKPAALLPPEVSDRSTTNVNSVSNLATITSSPLSLSSDRVRTSIASLQTTETGSRLPGAAVAAASVAPRLPEFALPGIAASPSRHSQFYNHRTHAISANLPREIFK